MNKNFSIRKIAAAIAVALAIPAIAAYAATVQGNVTLNASFGEQVSAGLINSETVSQAISQNDSYGAGTGSAQVDTFYAAQLSLAANTPQTIDLKTGLKDPAGGSIAFARVREFIVQNPSSTAGNDVKIYAPSSTGWPILPPQADPIYARYGSVQRVSDKYSTGSGNGNIVSGTASQVTFDPGSAAATINVLVLGCSAE